MTGDIYLLEGDVFFEPDALRCLTLGDADNVAAVAPFSPAMEGSAVVLTNNGYIADVRMKQTAANLNDGSPPLFKTMNLIRFSGGLRRTIVPHLNDTINAGAVKSSPKSFCRTSYGRKGCRSPPPGATGSKGTRLTTRRTFVSPRQCS